MSLTLAAYLLLFIFLTFQALQRPIYGVALYMLTYFGDPTSWWWGAPLESFRLNLFSAIIAIASVLIHNPPQFRRLADAWMEILLGLIVINGTFVHFILAERPDISFKAYDLSVKFAILAFLIKHCIKTKEDLIIFVVVLTIAIGHIGYEVKMNDAGKIIKGRLERVGPPTANASNQLASLLVTVLPVTGTLLLVGTRRQRWLSFLCAPFGVNTLLLCNSRGAFLGAICSAVVYIILAPPRARRTALTVVALGAAALLLLARDEKFFDRFKTTFAKAEERDGSASSRLDFWKAGLQMVRDYPLGAGGNGYKRVHGHKYRSATGHTEAVRSVHNGFINEACDWGIQGFFLRGTLYFLALFKAVVLARRLSRHGDPRSGLLAAAMAGGLAAFLTTSMFGDVFDNEWGMWLVSLIAAAEALANRGEYSVNGPVGYTLYRLVPVSNVPQFAPHTT